MSAERTFVIGADVAGLVLARDLAIAGVPVTVLDAGDRVGGRLAPITVGGIEVDGDVDAFDVAGGGIAALAAELGLEVVHPAAGAEWLVRGEGDARPLPAEHLLGIPAAPMVREVIDIVGVGAALRAQLDTLIPMLRPAKYEHLGDLVRRRMGRAILERLVAPVVRGTLGTTPEAVAIADASPKLPAQLVRTGTLAAAIAALRAVTPPGGPVAGLRGGLHGLVSTLAARATRVGVEIRLSAAIVAVDADGVLLTDGERLEGRVVVATPELVGLAQPTSHGTTAFAAVDSVALDAAPRGTRAVIAAGVPGIQARAFTHSSRRWSWLGETLPAHRHLIRLDYDSTPADPPAAIAADLRAITEVGDASIVDVALIDGGRSTELAPIPPGLTAIGEAAGCVGLAAVVAQARATAADLLAPASTDGTG